MARRFKMQSVLGTILDPAADKTLMTTLTVTLAYKELIPSNLFSFMSDWLQSYPICSAFGSDYSRTRRAAQSFGVLDTLHVFAPASTYSWSHPVCQLPRTLAIENMDSLLGLLDTLRRSTSNDY